MNGAGDLDYALARIAARRARRPGAVAWRTIESLRGFAPALAAARSAGFEEWLPAIDAHAGPHAIEAALRAAWRDALHALARWMPARWGPALALCAAWVDLPRLRGAAPRDAGDARELGRLRALLAVGDDRVDRAWQHVLLQRLRAAGATSDPAFQRLARLLDAHRSAFAALPPGNGSPSRAALESALLGFMHAGPPGPATAFAWVALLALEHERLRGALVSRAAPGVAA